MLRNRSINSVIVFALMALLTSLSAGCGLWDTVQARQLARDGNDLYKRSDYKGAVEKYLEARSLDPETPNLFLNLGYAYFSIYDMGEDETAAAKAILAFEEYLKRQPEDKDVQVFLIKTLLRAAPSDDKMADRALNTFLDMLKKNPADHEARQYLITLFIECKRYEDAVRFFGKDLENKPDDVETMKILAIIADKSKMTQAAVDWYWRRAEALSAPEKKALMLYEVGTYAWNLLHYQPRRHVGIEAIKLADQGIEACRQAMALKEKYAEAMIYGNLLFLKRALYDADEQGRFIAQARAFEMRKAAGAILAERKKQKQAKEEKAKEGNEASDSSEAKPKNDEKKTKTDEPAKTG
ncbi:MAG: tetratricopeptide repeat protein [Deltaproteobacteria bacterium]|nr:tetratricopeptide repeat protein [Deltaproteobacteria bacterium]